MDLNAELSGLNGALLNEQTNFVHESVLKILSLYPQNRINTPTSVILIGHSMGGVIAQLMLYKSSANVDVVITMATPHRRPSISLDNHITQFYDDVRSRADGNNRSNYTLVTLAGGNYDHLVHSWLTYDRSSTINAVVRYFKIIIFLFCFNDICFRRQRYLVFGSLLITKL